MQSPAKLWSSENRFLSLKSYMVIVNTPFYTEGKLAKRLVQGHRASNPETEPKSLSSWASLPTENTGRRSNILRIIFFNVIIFCPVFQSFMLMSVSGTVKVKKLCMVLRY